MFSRRCDVISAVEQGESEKGATKIGSDDDCTFAVEFSFKTQFTEVRLMKGILLGFLFLSFAACAFGQSLPVKEGLWESTVYDDDGSISMRLQNCITQKNYVEALAKANSQPGCKMTAQNITSHGITMDVSCSRPNVETSVHQVVELVDPEHTRGTTTMKMIYKGKTGESTTKSSSHFVKTDCGQLKPGDPAVIIEEKQ